MKKANHRTPRDQILDFQQIINVGPATAADFRKLGFQNPGQLAGSDPLEMYRQLCERTGEYQDPCVLDVFIATTDYMNGNPPKPWWKYTNYRKQRYGKVLADQQVRCQSACP